MEGLMKRLVALTVIISAASVLFLVTRGEAAPAVSEQWMKDHTPVKIQNYEFMPGQEDPQVSYVTSQAVYDTLNPFGIVCRKYRDNENIYDATIIAGDNRGSFHDPHVCFQAQGWTFSEDRLIEIETKTRGKIPATLAKIKSGDTQRIALFFYKGHDGFYPSTRKLTTAMAIRPLVGDFRNQAVFYRFMPDNNTASEEDVIEFAAAYMDAAGPISNGYF